MAVRIKLSGTACPQPLVATTKDIKYRVEFVNRFGSRSESVQVIVICDNDDVFSPNTFSPNGDGSNNVFYGSGKEVNRFQLLRIFNWWGQVVFEKASFKVTAPSAGCDGTYKGAKPVPSVYVYQMDVFFAITARW